MGISIPEFSLYTDGSNTVSVPAFPILLLVKEESPHFRVLKNKYEENDYGE
jgi:hypothetical protein